MTRPVAEARWCVEESDTGMPVAQGSAPTADKAIGEASRYAVQYAQDHPVRYWVRQGRKTLLQGSIAITNGSINLTPPPAPKD